MSTLGMFRRVSGRVIDDLLAHPDRIKQVLYPSSTETAIDDDVRMDVDTAWHALHFLLCGSAAPGPQPAAFVLGGLPVGPDLGNGPARLFVPSEVRKIATVLALVNVQTLRLRFDPATLMAERIYPEQWDRPGKANTFEAIAEAFDALKHFVTTTAQAEAGMIAYLL
jgi:hypothetical protein